MTNKPSIDEIVYQTRKEMCLWMLRNGYGAETSHDSTMSSGESIWAIDRDAFCSLLAEYGLAGEDSHGE